MSKQRVYESGTMVLSARQAGDGIQQDPCSLCFRRRLAFSTTIFATFTFRAAGEVSSLGVDAEKTKAGRKMTGAGY